MEKTLVEQFLEDAINRRHFLQERAVYEVTEMLEGILAEQGVTRSELAERLNKSRGWVTQLLDGEANKTVRTIADVCAVLNCEFKPSYRPIRITNEHEFTIRIFGDELEWGENWENGIDAVGAVG